MQADTLAELYFKYALANDDRGETKEAFEYYNKCIVINRGNPYKALAYANLASCYYENDNVAEAKNCFQKALDIEMSNNNYDGIYYNAIHLANIYVEEKSKKALKYLLEAKKSAEFLNEEAFIIESSIALGDYYYNKATTKKESLQEYLKAQKIAENYNGSIDIDKINQRINDMKLRMSPDEFSEIVGENG